MYTLAHRTGPKLRRWTIVAALMALGGLAAALVVARPGGKREVGPVQLIVSQITTSAGLVTATNHLVAGAGQQSGEYLVVWAGDKNIADDSLNGIVNKTLSQLDLNVERLMNVTLPDALPSNDFLAVIDADPKSSDYGKVVNTVIIAPLLENEPHHMQYVWHKGQRIYAGGLFSDTTYVFDVDQLPVVKLSGVNLPTDTLCGSVPDAYWVLNDGTAYGTYMGGPDLPGPCMYSNGKVSLGNGFAGTPGEIVRLGPDGRTLAEIPADTDLPADRDPARCPGVPTLVPSCANPHGIQVREDLNRMVTSDYAEPKNVVSDPLKPLHPNLFRDTVRIWDITNRNNPTITSVSIMPDGPRKERNPGHEEPRGIMETTVTNLPQHKGAFASSMCGGVIYYTPDITSANPVWKEVFDDSTASKAVNPNITEGAGCDGGGWVQTSRDDRYLYHAVIGRNAGGLGDDDPGVPKMVYTLDIAKLLAAGSSPQCSVDQIAEVFDGGLERDCPELVSVMPLPDGTSGGPHWGALDNFKPNGDGTWSENDFETRTAVSNYFVARSGVDGNNKVCMLNIARDGLLSLDPAFRDENQGTPCINFNRTEWPHGRSGAAKPHSQLFVVPAAKLR